MAQPVWKSSDGESVWQVLFVAGFGLVLGVGLLKWGNPVVLDEAVEVPKNRIELIFQAWPLVWGVVLVAMVVGLGFWRVARTGTGTPWWVLGLPATWFVWQLMCGAQSIRPDLTRVTLLHFGACLGCFYAGVFGLAKVERLRLFWLFLGTGLALVLVQGWQQHFGGLEETRRYILEQMGDRPLSPEFAKKIQSNRIFSTLVYPNALAGVIILLLPVVLGAVWLGGRDWPAVVRWGGVAGFGVVGGACLVWTGSKGGWLIAVGMVVLALWRGIESRHLRRGLALVVVVAGLAGFGLRYQGYFQKGATSVGARFDYWRAAARTFAENPWMGTGPGSFATAYQRIKSPEAEMARLTHNDFLQQASDSGWVGAVSFAGFILGSIGMLYRNSVTRKPGMGYWVWLGLVGWSAQSWIEFGLYVPAIAWPAFSLLGWLWGKAEAPNRIDTAAVGR